MQKIYAAVFGSGLGHVTRVHAVAKKLQSEKKEIEFVYSSFDEGYDYLKNQNETVFYAPPLPIKWNLTGGVSGKDTLVHFPEALADFSRQIEFEDRAIKKYRPQVVLSDSRLSAAWAAKRRAPKCVTILNQIRILFPPRFHGSLISRFLERIEANILGLMWSFSDEILFPDLPPPYTIGESNVSNIDTARKVKYTGFMIPKRIVEESRKSKVVSALGLDSSRPTVFMQISGPNASKRAFFAPALECAKRMSSKNNVVVSRGLPTGSSEPKRIANGAWVYDWCPVKDELFALANVFVARSGHTTIGQCIDSGKPSVLIPIYNHSEQIWNAEKFVKLGLGISIRNERLTPEKLEASVDSCLADPKYMRNIERMREISERYAGIDSAIKVIDEYL